MRRLFIVILVLAARAFAGAPTTQPISHDDPRPLIFHLPGIGGHRMPDVWLTQGLLAGGIDAEIYIYDWTGEDEGLNALTNVTRHEEQSSIIAEQIAAVVKRQPERKIILSCHSGGAGVAAWALEKLPADVQVDTWLIIAAAVSPEFDLSKALSHVRDRAYAFNSSTDTVLGFGTRNFGTIDRQKVDSAGKDGFIIPAGADKTQYAKLQQFQYDRAWLRLGHSGDHVGATMRPFARKVIAPLLITGSLPKLAPPATAPALK